jgi:hypothetical protein
LDIAKKNNINTTKIKKIYESHGFSSSDDMTDLLLTLISDEDSFIDKSKMPSDWNSDRAYASGFESMSKVLECSDVCNYVRNTVGNEQYDMISTKFKDLKKRHNNQAKKATHAIAADADTCSVSSNCEKCARLHDFLNGYIQNDPDPVRAYLFRHIMESLT